MGVSHPFPAQVHYAAFGSDGRGVPKARRAASFIYLCADCVTLLLLTLCAKGWNIVRRKLGVWTRVAITAFQATYACATIASLRRGGVFGDVCDFRLDASVRRG